MGRLAQDMKREVIAIIGRLKDPRLEGGLLTVTRLDVTPDLDVAKVYVSVMGREDGPKPAIEALNCALNRSRYCWEPDCIAISICGSIVSAVSAAAEHPASAKRQTAMQSASQILLILCFIFQPPHIRSFRAFWTDDPLFL